MKRTKEIVFFVLGVEKETKGRYLAKILRTQNGIDAATFDFKDCTLAVTYEPEVISVEDIKKLTYFSECVFISDESEIKRQIALLKKENSLEQYMKISGIAWGIIFFYVVFCEITSRTDSLVAYILLVLLTALIVVLYLFKRKIEWQKEEKIGNSL